MAVSRFNMPFSQMEHGSRVIIVMIWDLFMWFTIKSTTGTIIDQFTRRNWGGYHLRFNLNPWKFTQPLNGVCFCKISYELTTCLIVIKTNKTRIRWFHKWFASMFRCPCLPSQIVLSKVGQLVCVRQFMRSFKNEKRNCEKVQMKCYLERFQTNKRAI